MAFKRAKRMGGAFLDLRQLAQDEPVLAVFRIREFEDPEKNDYGSYTCPVLADVLICSGPQKGEVHLNERFIGAVTSTLRGVLNPKQGERPQKPENEIDDEIAGRIDVRNKGKNNEFAVIDELSDAENEAVEAVHADGKGWDGAAGPVGAGAGSGKPPW